MSEGQLYTTADMILRHVQRDLQGEVFWRCRRLPEVNRRLVFNIERNARIDSYRINAKYVEAPNGFMEALPCHEPIPGERESLKEIAHRLMESLDAQERTVVLRALFDGELKQVVAKMLKVSPSRVSHILRKARRKMRLRSYRVAPGLREELR